MSVESIKKKWPGCRILKEFRVLYAGWECDSEAWVLQLKDGRKIIAMTDHGSVHEADEISVQGRVDAYRTAIEETVAAIKEVFG